MFFGDTHLREYGSFPPFNQVEANGFTRELNNILRGFDFVVDKIKTEQPHHVFLLGDVFHTPEGVTTTTLHATAKALGDVKGVCAFMGAKFYLMAGNHDTQNEKLRITSTSVLSGFAQLLDKDTILKLHTPDDGEIYKIGVVQFSSDEEHIIPLLTKMSKSSDLIITHLDFQGCAYESGWRSESVIPTNFPIPIVSGDIHRTQRVGSVYYPGSLVQNRFTQTTSDGIGGVLTYDTKTGAFEHFPNTYSHHYVKIEKPEDFNGLDERFKYMYQIKYELEDRSFLEGLEHIYIPVAQAKVGDDNVDDSYLRLNVGTPFNMLKKYVSEHKPEAVNALESVLGEKHG